MLSLSAPASSLSLSQTSSDIRFRDMNLALLRIDITDCWLRNEYLVWLIISQLEQVVTQWNAILFQLFYGRSLYFYISNSDEIRTPKWSLPKRHLNFSMFLEKYEITVQPVITYIYLCVQLYAASLSYFSNLPPET